MRALQCVGAKERPEVREVEDPTPGPGQVLVRVGGAGACHSDLHIFEEFPVLPWPVPFTLGHENAGWVEALGAGVSGVEQGQPVAVYGHWGCGSCARCRAGMENYCDRQLEVGPPGGGLGRDGGMAPLLLVPSVRHLVPLRTLDPVEAAPLTDAGLTPYHAIKRSLPLLVPGATVVVIGAGGLGHMAVQILAASCAAQIVVVDQRAAALALATRLGAAHSVLAGEGAASAIRELTRGLGADVVLDFVGVDATMQLGQSVVRPLGHLTIVGIGGGHLDFSFLTTPNEVSIASTYWGSIPELHEVVALAEAGKIAARVQKFSLDEAPSAYAAMRAGALEGRAVIVP
jgi:alcohol dehydrogenase, propanol-preferring